MKNLNLKDIIYSNYNLFLDIYTFKNILRLKLQNIKNYQLFEQVFLETLHEYASLKKKFRTENHVPQMKKSSCKAIMQRTEIESKYLKNRTIENKTKCKKQNNYCKRLYKQERKVFFH